MEKGNKEKWKWAKPEFKILRFKQTLGGNATGVHESVTTIFGDHGTSS